MVEARGAPKAIGPYSPAVVLDGWVFVSGQIPVDPVSQEFVKGDAAVQAERVLLNLQALLEAAGTRLAKVVKTTIYLRSMADFTAVNEVYASFFQPPYPARVTIQAAALPRGADVEIDAIARI